MVLYAAYGTNLDPTRMAQRCPHSPLLGTGWLPGWRLTFGAEDRAWDGALVTVVESRRGEGVFVALYDITDEDAAVLDEWEGGDLDLYRKVRVRVRTAGASTRAWLYVLDGWEGGLPSPRHLSLLIDAAEAAGAPPAYVTELRQRPCRLPHA